MNVVRLLLWFLLPGSYVPAHSYNSVDLLSTLPVLARDGELTPVTVSVNKPWNFQGLAVVITYPEELDPSIELSSVQLVPEESLSTSVVEFNILSSGSRLAGAIVRSRYTKPDKVVFDFPFTGHTQSGPRVYTLTIDGELVFAGPAFVFKPITSTFTVLPKGESGDVNGDGKITPGDALWVIRKYIGAVEFSPQVTQSADVYPTNGDGKITLDDAVSLLRRSVGIE